jgi:hypothetical protein
MGYLRQECRNVGIYRLWYVKTTDQTTAGGTKQIRWKKRILNSLK